MENLDEFMGKYGWLILEVVIIITGAIIASRLYRYLMRKWLSRLAEKDPEDATRLKFMRNAGATIIWLLATTAIIYTIPQLRALAITLFAGAGILVAIAGFAAQKAFANVISGIFIVIFKPFRVHDFISIDTDLMGTVEDITLRHTVIKNFENQRIIIPNSVIGEHVITNWNLEDKKICKAIDVGISYGSDIDLAMKIFREVAQEHPMFLDQRSPAEIKRDIPAVSTRVHGFEDSSVTIRAWVWTDDPANVWQMKSDILKGVKERFDKEGVEIPFPYRTIVYKRDLPSEAQSGDDPKSA
jgi:small-conductance mechanosensitive channel